MTVEKFGFAFLSCVALSAQPSSAGLAQPQACPATAKKVEAFVKTLALVDSTAENAKMFVFGTNSYGAGGIMLNATVAKTVTHSDNGQIEIAEFFMDQPEGGFSQAFEALYGRSCSVTPETTQCQASVKAKNGKAEPGELTYAVLREGKIYRRAYITCNYMDGVDASGHR